MVRRGLKKPPKVIIRRIAVALRAELDRFSAPRYRRFRSKTFLRELGSASIDELWLYLSNKSYITAQNDVTIQSYQKVCAGDAERIFKLARQAMDHQVNILGSGLIQLDSKIDWHRDFKSGIAWPVRYFRDIEYSNLDQPSDVKLPWELSRMQWLFPIGQAYKLTSEEKYARFMKGLLEDWMDSNPYALGVNWACTMEVAIRVFSFTWFFHVFSNSASWRDSAFRERFLKSIYLHIHFTDRHIERSDINGNHYTADASALAVGGLFFDQLGRAAHWHETGWSILQNEIQNQVFSDGVDFELSVAYHRLVAELFMYPALFRIKLGLDVEESYLKKLDLMARFTAAYTKPDNTSPLWGDADDARVLPFGSQSINDHRYLVGLMGIGLNNQSLMKLFEGPVEEIFWVFGESAIEKLLANPADQPIQSVAFFDGGFFVMRSKSDYVFIDCGPIGLAGRGGHGHNDCLSFEAVLNGVSLVSDCGAFSYTGSYIDRNAFRSTAFHNTPQIDDEEINRFIRPEYLWNMHYDAKPELIRWEVDEDQALFVGEHHGYHRLKPSVRVRRSILMDFRQHVLCVRDEFKGAGSHKVDIPFHLSPGVSVEKNMKSGFDLRASGESFHLSYSEHSGYSAIVDSCRISQSYGTEVTSKKIIWRSNLGRLKPLSVCLAPSETSDDVKANLWRQLSDVNEI